MYNWKDSEKHHPNLRDCIIVKMFNGDTFYAVYSGDNEYDLHKLNDDSHYRKNWYKFSNTTIKKWRYFK